MEIKDVICPSCGCLCDDIELTIENEKITKVGKACAIGRSLFLNHNNDLAKPMVNGSEVAFDEAIEQAVSILSSSQNLLVYGLSSTSCEAQRKAIELTEFLGGNIDSTSSVCHGPTTVGYQVVGEVTATLGEIKNLSDLLVFWGCNPAEAHMRHMARYSASARGLFTAKGRKDRTVVVVDVRRTRTAKRADLFIQVKHNRDLELIQAIRTLIKGKKLDAEEISGVPVDTIINLAEKMKEAHFGAILFGMGLTMTRGKHLNIAAVLSLVRDLNNFTKFIIMPMRGHFNVAGADATLTWVTGYPFAVNFGRGYPQYGPGEYTAVDLLARREVDTALIISSDPTANFPRQAASYLAEIPTIVIDPKRSKTTEIARVVIPTAPVGISAEGTAYRMDGVPLRLKKVIEPLYASDEEVLGQLMERVKASR